MIEFLTYDLKVAVLLAVFYMFYRLMLARETFHRVNRIVLLLTAVASYVLPLCVITILMQRAAHVAVGSFQVDMMNEEPATPLWQIILPILFIIGMMATLVHTLSSLFRIIRIIRHSEQYPQTDGTTICVTGNASLTPFSWMHYIVMNRSDYETYDAAILAHERGHIRLHHSWGRCSGTLSRHQCAPISIPVNHKSRGHRRVLPCQRHLSQYPQKPNQYDVTY